VRTEALMIDGPAGKLEVLLEAPPAQPLATSQHHAPAAFAVICHPHPLYGGSMQNKVVYTIARACQERAMATLRFNFRGVGASVGSYDEGRGEIQDTLAVIAAGRARWPQAALTLAGFSFGAVVSLMAAAAAAPSRLISVAPAVGRVAPASIARPACPWLIVQGDADEVVDARAVQAFAAGFSPPPQLVVLPGVGHFFHSRLDQLRDAAIAFLAAT
jgi:alpha/beta superfamily hydrolase